VALGETAPGIDALNQGLTWSIAASDDLCRFYAHYYLWKTHDGAGDRERAAVELENARYYVRFVDEQTPEVAEVRAIGAELGRVDPRPRGGRAIRRSRRPMR
jgi:hypothetical protein